MSLKSFSHLMPLLNCGQVNPSTPIFPDINLTQKMTDLLTPRKIIEKYIQ